MFDKLLSLMLVPLIFLHTLLPFLLGNRNAQTLNEESMAQLHSLQDYIAFVEENGAPAYSTEHFVRQAEPLYEFLRVLSGRPMAKGEDKTLGAHIDSTLSELCGFISENSGIDVEMLIETLPNLNRPAELVNQTLHLDTQKMRARVFVLRDLAYENDQALLGHLLYFYAVYWSVIREVSIYTVPYEADPAYVEVMMDVVYDDGDRAVTHPGILIDPVTGEVRGPNGRGMIDLGFDVNVYDLIVYGTVDCWQRALGFDLSYQAASDLTALYNLDTRRFHFVYGGKQWMLQIWKGNYGLASNGLEVGLYNRPRWSVGTFYYAAGDDELLPMSATLSHGDTVLMQTSTPAHWWLSAFKLSRVLYLPSQLTMTFSLTLPNEEMLHALTAAMDAHAAHDVTYTVDGLTVTGVF